MLEIILNFDLMFSLSFSNISCLFTHLSNNKYPTKLNLCIFLIFHNMLTEEECTINNEGGKEFYIGKKC